MSISIFASVESDIQVTDSLTFWRECPEVNTSPRNVSWCVIMLGFVRRSSGEDRSAQQTIAGTSNEIHAITANCRARGLPPLVPNADYRKVTSRLHFRWTASTGQFDAKINSDINTTRGAKKIYKQFHFFIQAAFNRILLRSNVF